MNKIKHYTVRRPGNTAWLDEMKTFEEAKREKDFANRTCAPGHEIYARHVDGIVTGPYPEQDWEE